MSCCCVMERLPSGEMSRLALVASPGTEWDSNRLGISKPLMGNP
jgi:hypothetical protein